MVRRVNPATHSGAVMCRNYPSIQIQNRLLAVSNFNVSFATINNVVNRWNRKYQELSPIIASSEEISPSHAYIPPSPRHLILQEHTIATLKIIYTKDSHLHRQSGLDLLVGDGDGSMPWRNRREVPGKTRTKLYRTSQLRASSERY